MNNDRLRVLSAIAFAALIVAAAMPPEDYLRQGNAAFTAGDYPRAIELYAKAERDTLDPGQIAYNKAAAHYELAKTSKAAENYLLANDHYRRSLEDAVGARRIKALYGLGNALAQQGWRQTGKESVDLLKAALQSYEECRNGFDALSEADQAECRNLLASSAANAEKIKPILKVREEELAKKPEKPKNPDEKEKPKTNPHDPPLGKPKKPEPEKGGPQSTKPGNLTTKPEQRPVQTHETKAGKGQLEPLKNEKEIEDLHPESVEDYLDQRIREIRAHIARRAPGETVKGKLPKDY